MFYTHEPTTNYATPTSPIFSFLSVLVKTFPSLLLFPTLDDPPRSCEVWVGGLTLVERFSRQTRPQRSVNLERQEGRSENPLRHKTFGLLLPSTKRVEVGVVLTTNGLFDPTLCLGRLPDGDPRDLRRSGPVGTVLVPTAWTTVN